MSTTFQPGIVELLELAGANPPRFGRGKWTCPNCQRPALSVNTDKQVFNCHHAGCDFHGGIGTLRQRLGIEREWLPKPEYIRQCRECESVHDAALRLYAAAKARRFARYDELRILARMETGAHIAGLTEAAWDTLALVYAERPVIECELDILENSGAAELISFLDPGERNCHAHETGA